MDEMRSAPPPLPEHPLPPQQPRQPLPVMEYATKAPGNNSAVLSLVFGLMFFVPLAAPGIAAILLGRRGLRNARKEAAGGAGLARAGIVLGVVNLVLSVGFFALAPVAVIRARQQAMAVQCMSNMRQLAMVAMMYSAANKGLLPPTLDHLATMTPARPGATIFTCPACGNDPAKPPVFVSAAVRSHYHYIPPAPRLAQVRQPHRVVLAYEPPTHHDNRAMNLLFCDGHVEAVRGPLMAKVAAELAAGQNPPPSKP